MIIRLSVRLAASLVEMPYARLNLESSPACES
jgi:hypothetical protein